MSRGAIPGWRIWLTLSLVLAGLGVLTAAGLAAARTYDEVATALAPPPLVEPWGGDVWDEELFAFLEEYGERPGDAPYTDDEMELAITNEADILRRQFAIFHPDAAPPDAEFVAVDDESRIACLGESQVEVDAWDVLSVIPEDVGVASQAVDCFIRYPPYPHLRPTDAQLRWFYDYITVYVAPCLEAHGVPQTTPPTVDEFLASWPLNWYVDWPIDGPPFVDGYGDDLCPSYEGY